MGKLKKSSLGNRELEFGGIPGAMAMVVGLPVAVYYINLVCNKVNTACIVLNISVTGQDHKKRRVNSTLNSAMTDPQLNLNAFAITFSGKQLYCTFT